MNSSSQDAIRSNVPEKPIFFDMETTGKITHRESKIWQFAARKGDETFSIFMRADPFDKNMKGPMNVHKTIPAAYTANTANLLTEKEGLTAIGKFLAANKGGLLVGQNIQGFDIPFLINRFKENKIVEGLEALHTMQSADTMLMAKKLLKEILPDSMKDVIGISKREIYAGVRLGELGAAFGVDLTNFTAHTAESDSWLAEQLYNILKDPNKAKEAYDIEAHIKAVDETRNPLFKGEYRERYLQGATTVEDTRALEALKSSKPGAVHTTWTELLSEPSAGSTRAETFAANVSFLKKKIATAQVSEPPLLFPVSGIIEKVKEFPKDTKKTGLKEIKSISSSMLKDAKEMAQDVSEEASKFLKSSLGKKAVKWGLIGAGAYVVGKYLLDIDFNKKNRDQYISASYLGKGEDDLLRMAKSGVKLYKEPSEGGPRSSGEDVALKVGKQVHKQVQKELEEEGIGVESEYQVYDDELGVKGNVDIVAKTKGTTFPIEVKTTSTENLKRLTEPMPEHASQVNFYAHALGASGGHVMYVSAEDTSLRKSFYIPYSSGKLIRDVADFRETLIKNRSYPGIKEAWPTHSKDFMESVASADYYNPEPYILPPKNKSKIRDQATRSQGLSPMGSPYMPGNITNRSRQERRN